MKNIFIPTALKSDQRISSIDVFRGIAILAVVLFHYNHLLPFGNLGVDLFFVISGLLIGGILLRDYKGENLKYFRFILQRGFKIWPSYYFFLFAGNILIGYLYSEQDKRIPLWDMKRYVLFYQNYTGVPFHWEFDHVWSLCVEEHFYILFPLLLITLLFLFRKSKHTALFISLIAIIISGVVFKYISLEFTNGKDSYSATHNRIDALAWGVLLALILSRYEEKLKNSMSLPYLSFIGVILFGGAIFAYDQAGYYYQNVVFHSIVPIAVFLTILGMYFRDFKKFTILRIIAFYSYNWYLWHPLFAEYFTNQFGDTWTGTILYLMTTFIVAVITTNLIEIPFLKIRRRIL